MDIQIFNSDGTPAIDSDGNFVYEQELLPNWDGFKNEFARNIKWIMYGNVSPLLSSRIETLALSEMPDVATINNMIQLLFSINPPSEDELNEWQAISNKHNTGIIFKK